MKIAIMDTTYFGREFSVMVLFDSLSKQTLSVEPVRYEKNALYFTQIHHLKTKGIEIQSIICDGRKGLSALFTDIPVQLCQFHQVKTLIHYLARKPKSTASQGLLLANSLPFVYYSEPYDNRPFSIPIT